MDGIAQSLVELGPSSKPVWRKPDDGAERYEPGGWLTGRLFKEIHVGPNVLFSCVRCRLHNTDYALSVYVAQTSQRIVSFSPDGHACPSLSALVNKSRKPVQFF